MRLSALRVQLSLACAAALAAVSFAGAGPAQASTCHVAVTRTQHTVQGKRYAGTCRWEVTAVFNLPGQNGVHFTGNDATSGYSTIYVPNGNSVSAGWRLS